MLSENYVYKKEVDWSLYTMGLLYLLIIRLYLGRLWTFLKRGESRILHYI